jgi:hypothetical protein
MFIIIYFYLQITITNWHFYFSEKKSQINSNLMFKVLLQMSTHTQKAMQMKMFFEL